jgi:hypothetical protein
MEMLAKPEISSDAAEANDNGELMASFLDSFTSLVQNRLREEKGSLPPTAKVQAPKKYH